MHFCGGVNNSADLFFKRISQEKEKAREAGNSENRRTERTPRKCFRCGSEDHLTTKCPNLPKENKKRRKQESLNKKSNCACDKGNNNSDQKIYSLMALMSCNDKCPSGNFGDSSQFTN